MRLAIIADIHDNLANLAKVLKWSKVEKTDKLICLGDLTTTETITYLATNFDGEIFVVQGNCEIYSSSIFSQYQNLTDLGTGKNISLDNLLIGCCHEPENIDKLFSSSQPAEQRPNFIFYGHTHKPWLKKQDQINIINPGNVAGVFHQATFAVLDTVTHQLDLKILAEMKWKMKWKLNNN